MKRWGALLAYLGWWNTGVVVWVKAKDPDLKFHAAQSTLFFGAITVLGVMPLDRIVAGAAKSWLPVFGLLLPATVLLILVSRCSATLGRIALPLVLAIAIGECVCVAGVALERVVSLRFVVWGAGVAVWAVCLARTMAGDGGRFGLPLVARWAAILARSI